MSNEAKNGESALDRMNVATRKTSELLNNFKTIAVMGFSAVLVIWGVFDQFDKKFDEIGDLKGKLEEIANNSLLSNNAIQKVVEKVDRLTESMVGNERRVVVVEEKLRIIEEKVRQASQVNSQVPLKFIDSPNNSVLDAKPGEYTQLTIMYDKFRDSCQPKLQRYIQDSAGVLHDITKDASVEQGVSPVGSNQTARVLIKLPDASAIAIGSARYQSRVSYTCTDGGTFIITSPWIGFNVLEPKKTTRRN